jgi:Xaa-Pro aminopeptidase
VIDKEGLDAFLVSQPENCRYLSRFTGEGHLLISGSHALLATDSRYTVQAKEEAPGFETIRIKGDLPHWLPGLASDFGWHKLGFEANFVSYHSHHKLSEAIKTKQLNLELIPTTSLVEHLRAIKEPAELELITKAV